MADKAKQVIVDAHADADAARRFLDDPVAAFRSAGIDYGDQADPAAAQHLAEVAPELHKRLSAIASGEPLGADAMDDCDACKAAVLPLTSAILALGTASLVMLGPEAPLVVAIASAVGAEAVEVQLLLRGLATVLNQGRDAVSQAICGGVGRCQ